MDTLQREDANIPAKGLCVMLEFENCSYGLRAVRDGYQIALIRDAKLQHIKEGISSEDLRQIADKLDELNGVKNDKQG